MRGFYDSKTERIIKLHTDFLCPIILPMPNPTPKEKVEALKQKLAGLNMQSICVIASRDDLILTHGGPAKNMGAGKDGKFVGWITLGPDDRCRPLINTEPIYTTGKEADDAMKGIQATAKELVAIPEYQAEMPPILRALMGFAEPTPESKIVGAVIAVARS